MGFLGIGEDEAGIVPDSVMEVIRRSFEAKPDDNLFQFRHERPRHGQVDRDGIVGGESFTPFIKPRFNTHAHILRINLNNDNKKIVENHSGKLFLKKLLTKCAAYAHCMRVMSARSKKENKNLQPAAGKRSAKNLYLSRDSIEMGVRLFPRMRCRNLSSLVEQLIMEKAEKHGLVIG